jgi:hypothetical protein
MTPKALARIAGLFYALNFVLGMLALNWMQTGRAGADTMQVIAAADYAIVALLLGRLFEPAGRALSWAVAAIGLIGCLLSAVGPLGLFASPVNALAVFGLYCFGLGVLAIRSELMPRIIGWLLMLGGVSWLTFAAPELAQRLAPWNMAPGGIAELIFTLWLLVFGVREARLAVV